MTSHKCVIAYVCRLHFLRAMVNGYIATYHAMRQPAPLIPPVIASLSLTTGQAYGTRKSSAWASVAHASRQRCGGVRLLTARVRTNPVGLVILRLQSQAMDQDTRKARDVLGVVAGFATSRPAARPLGAVDLVLAEWVVHVAAVLAIRFCSCSGGTFPVHCFALAH